MILWLRPCMQLHMKIEAHEASAILGIVLIFAHLNNSWHVRNLKCSYVLRTVNFSVFASFQFQPGFLCTVPAPGRRPCNAVKWSSRRRSERRFCLCYVTAPGCAFVSRNCKLSALRVRVSNRRKLKYGEINNSMIGDTV